jgi:hypothetical protein
MSNEVFVDTDPMNGGVSPIESFQDTLAKVAAAANQVNAMKLNQGDSIGKQFAKVYDAPASNLVEGIDAAASTFGQVAKGLKTMANGYTTTEEGNTDAARSLGGSSS